MSSDTLFCDAHAHAEGIDDLYSRRENHVFSLFCAKNSAEYRALQDMLEACPDLRKSCALSLGLHPWCCEDEDVRNVLPLLRNVPVIGEIGLDCVWCKTKLSLQKKVMLPQLEAAYLMGKPVILHTKGMEQVIGEIIQSYPLRYLVHWYSCDRAIPLYERMDCWFSIGPDVAWNKSVRSLAKHVRSDRILMETDGMDAVRWAYRKGSLDERGLTAADVLSSSLAICAALRGIDRQQLARQCLENFDIFLRGY